MDAQFIEDLIHQEGTPSLGYFTFRVAAWHAEKSPDLETDVEILEALYALGE